MSASTPGPHRHHFDNSLPLMAFRRDLTAREWATLERIADDVQFTGSSDANVLSLLWVLIRSNQLRSVLQIGTWIGFSAVVLAAALRAPEGLLMTIDPALPELTKARDYVAAAGLAERVRCQAGRSDDTDVLAAATSGAPWDLVYIDSAHDYAVALRELELYWPLVRTSGFLVMHDAAPAMAQLDSAAQGGVYRACREWVEAQKVPAVLLRPPVWANPCGALLAVKA